MNRDRDDPTNSTNSTNSNLTKSLELLALFVKGFIFEFMKMDYVAAISVYESILDIHNHTAHPTLPIPNACLLARSRLAFLFTHSRPGVILNIRKGREHQSYLALNPIKTRSWLDMAAEWGIKEAEYCLALSLYNGIGYPAPNYSLAFQYAQSAADKGLALAQNLVGNMYIEGTALGGRNSDLGLHYYLLAGEQMEPTSIYNIGTLFERGIGVSQDIIKAIEWFNRAAKLGSLNAHSVLGILHHRGLVPSTNPRLAFNHYKEAAFHGHPLSLYNLARCFQDGFGCIRDPKQAFLCFHAAAQQDLPKAVLSQAICHEFGLGTLIDKPRAIVMYQEAARLDLEEARIRLVPIYMRRIMHASHVLLRPIPSSSRLAVLPRELRVMVVETLNRPPILTPDEVAEVIECAVTDEVETCEAYVVEMEVALRRGLSKVCSCPSDVCDRVTHILYGLQSLDFS